MDSSTTGDITGYKNSLERIERYSRIFEDSLNEIYLFDADTLKFTQVNNAAQQNLGYSMAELQKMTPLDIKPEFTAELFAKSIEPLRKGEKTKIVFYTVHQRKDQSLYNVEVHLQLQSSKDGAMFVAIILDITVRKQAEEDSELFQSLLKAALESTADGILVVTREGVWSSFNQKFVDMWRIPTSIRESGDDKAALDYVFGSIANPEKFLAVVKELYDDPGRTSFDTIELKDGRIFERYSNPQKLGNKVVGRVWSFRDITERRRAEQIQKVLYNISNAVTTSDNLRNLIILIQKELGTIIDTTNFYVALYDHRTDMFSVPFIVDEKDSLDTFPAGKTLTSYVNKTKKPFLGTKKRLNELTQSGDIEVFGTDAKVWLGVPLQAEGNVTGVLAVQSYTDENAYDESDMKLLEFVSDQISLSIHRKKAEEDLITALTKAKESDRLKSAFLANMSHEIRTPMNGILGFAELLKEPDLSMDELQSYVSVIESSGDRMLNTINDLIDISKIEANQMEVFISMTVICELTDDLYSFFKPEAEKKGLQFIYKNTLTGKEASIKTDKEKLYAVLTNLIKNSIKYTHKGSIEFGYQVKDSFIEFFVKDTGIGIPKDRQQAIFERFVQADFGKARSYEGAGLGLSITKAYVEMLGGGIRLESEVGKGSQFIFTIPYNHIMKDEVASKDTTTEMKSEPKIKKLKILIVEDDETADLHLSLVMKCLATEIFHSKTGKEAVEFCRNNPDTDLVLMDIKMPEIDGHEAARRIREFNKKVVIIAQTAYALEGDREQALEAGCNDYITKPIKKDVLLAMVLNHFKS